MSQQIIKAAYYYPGWHPCPVRDASFAKGWSEWDLVFNAEARFPGHNQPSLPLWGRENEAEPGVFAKKIETAAAHEITAFIFAYYWSRGKRLLEGALNHGFLQSHNRNKIKFALMWANRMPRRVMPVKDASARVIDPTRLVFTDPKDFVSFITHISETYFNLPEYLELNGGKYLSIFDTTFFIRQLGIENARAAISQARNFLAKSNMQLHLAAIDPIPEHQPLLKEIGFDSVSHYVFLPDWKGPYLQDFDECSRLRVGQWAGYSNNTGLPYFPAVTPGWDATPRSVDYGKEKPGKYPWSPIVTGNSPEKFQRFVNEALGFVNRQNLAGDSLCLISSWNEWSEGHYLEPDQKHGYAWLEAVKNAEI